MSERSQTLMRTRCPGCGTAFRVTSEQLRLRAGKVRCGHCQAVFNAFESMLPETEVLPPSPPVSSLDLPAETAPAADLPEPGVPQPEPEPEPEPEPALPASGADPLEAQQAGLVAARELSLSPGHDRWAAGTLASTGLDAFDNGAADRLLWPYVLAAVLLGFLLAGQAVFQFRTEIVQRFPASQALYRGLAVTVPLARDAELVAIETSDLQFDNARSLFMLQATVHNRAAHEQAWPALELSLTDTNDALVSRRVIQPAEYLTAEQASRPFATNEAAGIRLWVEARDLGAVGYRLYVFYP